MRHQPDYVWFGLCLFGLLVGLGVGFAIGVFA